jgi:hypothetical protein
VGACTKKKPRCGCRHWFWCRGGGLHGGGWFGVLCLLYLLYSTWVFLFRVGLGASSLRSPPWHVFCLCPIPLPIVCFCTTLILYFIQLYPIYLCLLTAVPVPIYFFLLTASPVLLTHPIFVLSNSIYDLHYSDHLLLLRRTSVRHTNFVLPSTLKFWRTTSPPSGGILFPPLPPTL